MWRWMSIQGGVNNLRNCHAHLRPPLVAGSVAAGVAVYSQATHRSTGLMDHFGELCDHSWITQLAADPETESMAPNKRSRQVKSGG